jgi:predicted nucleotidyltransferase
MTSHSLSRKSDGSLARVLASKALARVITHFVMHPQSALHFRALQRVTGVPSRSLQHELTRLQELGMVERKREGQLVRYRAVPAHPRWRAVRELVRAFAEPAEVLCVALARVPGVDAAFIFGSCARKTDVHSASDIDVFVLGERVTEPEIRFALAEQTLEASGLLGREINLTRYTPRRFAEQCDQGTRFLQNVLAGAKQWLVGDESTLSGARRDPSSREQAEES